MAPERSWNLPARVLHGWRRLSRSTLSSLDYCRALGSAGAAGLAAVGDGRREERAGAKESPCLQRQNDYNVHEYSCFSSSSPRTDLA